MAAQDLSVCNLIFNKMSVLFANTHLAFLSSVVYVKKKKSKIHMSWKCVWKLMLFMLPCWVHCWRSVATSVAGVDRSTSFCPFLSCVQSFLVLVFLCLYTKAWIDHSIKYKSQTADWWISFPVLLPRVSVLRVVFSRWWWRRISENLPHLAVTKQVFRLFGCLFVFF